MLENHTTPLDDGMPASQPPQDASGNIQSLGLERHLAVQSTTTADVLTGDLIEADEAGDYRSIVPPTRVERLMQQHLENVPRQADAVRDHVLAAAQDLRPVTNMDWLDVNQIGQLGHEIVELRAHAARLTAMMRRAAVREILKPGWSEFQPGGAYYDPRQEITSANELIVDGVTLSLSLACDAQTEATLERLAKESCDAMSVGAFGIATQAFRLVRQELEQIQRMIASAEARRQALRIAYEDRRPARIAPTPVRRRGHDE